MFSGIIETVAEVIGVTRGAAGVQLELRVPGAEGDLQAGSSLAVNGVCLTVTETRKDILVFDAVGTTLKRTLLETLEVGSRVNVEKSLCAGMPLDGHWVTGHVDGVGTVVSRTPGEGAIYFEFKAPTELVGQIALRGSIAVDGVSLTVAEVDGPRFQVSVVPFTLKQTVFKDYVPGSRVHLETDILAKYVEKNLKEKRFEVQTEPVSMEKTR